MARVHELDVAAAPDGGAFVVRRLVSDETFAERFDGDGRAQWDPAGNGVFLGKCFIDCYDVPVERVRLSGDGSGGVWIVNRVDSDAEIQHLDADGRPLYRRRR